MMTKQQKQSELKELINGSGINQAIERLELKLKKYERLEVIKKNRYVVQQEFTQMEKEIRILKNRIENLIELSNIWEKE